MFIPYLPIEGLHDFNLDWFLKKFHELREKWEETEAAWLALKEYVETFFDELDVQEEINNKIDAMKESGDLGRLIYSLINSSIFPAFVDSIADMTNKAIPYVLTPEGYIYVWSGDAWTNTGVRYGGGIEAIASSRIVINNDNYGEYRDFDLLSKNKVYAFTARGVENMLHRPPTTQNGTLIDYAYDGRDNIFGGRMQIYFDTTNKMYYRQQFGNTWGSWSPNIYGEYTHDTDFNANEVNAPSVHYLYNLRDTQNLPLNFTQGALITLSASMPTRISSQNVAVQNIISTAGTFMYRFKWNGVFSKWIKLNNIGGIITDLTQLGVNALANLDGNSFYTMTDSILKSLTDCPQGLPEANNPTVISRSIYNDPLTNQSTATQEIITYKYHLMRRKHSGVWESWRYVKKRCGLLISGDTIEQYTEYHNADSIISTENAVIGLTAFENENVEMENYPYRSDQLLSRTNGVDGINPTYGSTEVIRTIDEGVTFTRTNWNGIWQEWQADNEYHTHDYFSYSDRPITETSNVLFMGDSLFTVTGGSRSIPGLIGDKTHCAYYNLSVGGARIDNTYSGSTLLKQLVGVDDIANKDNIDMVIISIGTNDAGARTPKEDIYTYLSESITAIRAALPAVGGRIFIVSPMPRHGMSRTVVYNALILEACKKLGVNFINGSKIPVVPTPYYTDLQTDTVDGLHYTDKAKEYIANWIISKILKYKINRNYDQFGGHNWVFQSSESAEHLIQARHFNRSTYTYDCIYTINGLYTSPYVRFQAFKTTDSPHKGFRFEIQDNNGNTKTYDLNYLYFGPTNANSVIPLGSQSLRWDTIYLNSAPVIVSDETEKDNIVDINELLINIAKTIKAKQYTLKNEDNSKKHFGFIAQDIVKSFEKYNLSAFDYGLIEKSENGSLLIRYDELFALLLSI